MPLQNWKKAIDDFEFQSKPELKQHKNEKSSGKFLNKVKSLLKKSKNNDVKPECESHKSASKSNSEKKASKENKKGIYFIYPNLCPRCVKYTNLKEKIKYERQFSKDLIVSNT